MTLGILEEINSTEVTTPVRVLILENSQHDVELMLFELRDSKLPFEHTLAEDRVQFLAALEEGKFDAILSDFRLTNWTGLDALKHVRKTDPDVPFLLVTGTLGEEAAVDCIKEGVNDYILKDHISRLPHALRRALAEKALRDERTKALEALRVSEAKNRDLVAHSVYGIFHATEDGTFVDANPALLRILGCDSEQSLAAMNLVRDVFRFPEQYVQYMASCRQMGQVHGVESEWRRRDGGLVAVRLHIRSLSIPDHPGTIEVIAEDVTELRAMERQLRQAQKFEAIGQLAGGIAHDFNNVVGAILGWAELGFDQCSAHPQIAERFKHISEQGNRAAALTRELLAFARRQVLQPRAVDLNSIASGLVTFLDRVIGKDIEIKVLSTPLDPVKADPTQVEQVLMNLCLNARDAMPDGGRLVIETEMVELDDTYCHFYPYVTPGRYAVLCVSDTGMGMDAETRERIFEPFFTTKERGKGTGMGLATVYGIVKQHGGSIHVYSEPAHGTLFRVYFPVMEEATAETTAQKPPPPPFIDMHGTETILLAEDHESIREMARQTLVGLGYKVITASDGEEALHIAQQQTPALAVLDLIMPKLGGPALALKLNEIYGHLPIIFTSGYSQDSAALAAAIAEARFLQKPYSPTSLGRMVRDVLDDVKAHRASG